MKLQTSLRSDVVRVATAFANEACGNGEIDAATRDRAIERANAESLLISVVVQAAGSDPSDVPTYQLYVDESTLNGTSELYRRLRVVANAPPDSPDGAWLFAYADQNRLGGNTDEDEGPKRLGVTFRDPNLMLVANDVNVAVSSHEIGIHAYRYISGDMIEAGHNRVHGSQDIQQANHHTLADHDADVLDSVLAPAELRARQLLPGGDKCGSSLRSPVRAEDRALWGGWGSERPDPPPAPSHPIIIDRNRGVPPASGR